MSLYERLNLIKQTDRCNRIPIWERINFNRPHRPRCMGCRLWIQPDWRICPQCGFILSTERNEKYHCIWINTEALGSNLLSCVDRSVDLEKASWNENQVTILEALEDSFAKVFSAFRSIHVFLTSESPNVHQWGDNFTYLGLIIDREDVDYLGIASFMQGKVISRALVRLDRIISISKQVNLSSSQLSNLIANTIAHEIGHTLGLDHSALPTDVMHDGLDHRIHSLMPPSFHAEQIARMNYAICQFRATNF